MAPALLAPGGEQTAADPPALAPSAGAGAQQVAVHDFDTTPLRTNQPVAREPSEHARKGFGVTFSWAAISCLFEASCNS